MAEPEMFEFKPVASSEKGDKGENRKVPKSGSPSESSTELPFGTLDTKDVKLSPQHKRDVDTALAAMETMYTLLQMGVLFTGRKETAESMANNFDQVQASNRQSFESSAKLAHQIANAGNVSAVGTFALANVMYLGGLARSYVDEGKAIKAKKENPEPKREEGDGYTETGQGEL